MQASHFCVLGLLFPRLLKAYGSRVVANNRILAAGAVMLLCSTSTSLRSDIHAAVSLRCEFVFPRPLSHYGTGKNAGKLKILRQHHTKPRLDKTARAVDSLSDAVARFAQTISNRFHLRNKRYQTDDFLGAIITVTALD